MVIWRAVLSVLFILKIASTCIIFWCSWFDFGQSRPLKIKVLSLCCDRNVDYQNCLAQVSRTLTPVLTMGFNIL